ncbi:MAG: YdcH family protein [Hyphomonadaceae bacterium]
MSAAPTARLARRHAALEEALRQELKRPSPDFIRVKQIKQLKLRAKDAIADTARS